MFFYEAFSSWGQTLVSIHCKWPHGSDIILFFLFTRQKMFHNVLWLLLRTVQIKHVQHAEVRKSSCVLDLCVLLQLDLPLGLQAIQWKMDINYLFILPPHTNLKPLYLICQMMIVVFKVGSTTRKQKIMIMMSSYSATPVIRIFFNFIWWMLWMFYMRWPRPLVILHRCHSCMASWIFLPHMLEIHNESQRRMYRLVCDCNDALLISEISLRLIAIP